MLRPITNERLREQIADLQKGKEHISRVRGAYDCVEPTVLEKVERDIDSAISGLKLVLGRRLADEFLA